MPPVDGAATRPQNELNVRLFTVFHRISRYRPLEISEEFLRKFARRTKSYSNSDRNPDRDSGKDSDFFHRTARISKLFRFFPGDGFDTVDGIKPAEFRSNRRSFVMFFCVAPKGSTVRMKFFGNPEKRRKSNGGRRRTRIHSDGRSAGETTARCGDAVRSRF